ncbi:MAG: MdtA/MuxA family multidrug efflux RND transporter periplasmic adaptor subunit [Terriglobia bacterium]
MTTNTTPTQLIETTRRPRKRGLIWLVLLLAVAGMAGYAVWRASQPNLIPVPEGGGGRGRGRGRAAAGAGGAATPVVVAKAKAMDVPVYLNGIGNASAYNTVVVKTRVDGQLMSVNFKEGDFVKQGQVLAEIDPRPYQVQLEVAEGTFARDSATLANAKLDLQRYQTLLAQDAIAKQQLDTQVATVGQIEGSLKTDQANIDSAKLNLTYAHIIAPISGRIGLRLVDPGNIVHASDSNGLLVITQLQPISALFTIPEDNLPQVMSKIRQGVHLQVEAFNRDNTQKLATGTLVTADNQIDQSTGTSKLKAVFPNTNNALFPNQFLYMRLLVDTKRHQIVVPSVAIQHGQQGNFVFLVGDNSKVKIQQVVPDIVIGDNTSISSGLSDGDSVVVDGTDRLQDNSTVRIRKPGDDGMGGGRGRGGRGRSGRGSNGRGAGPS